MPSFHFAVPNFVADAADQSILRLQAKFPSNKIKGDNQKIIFDADSRDEADSINAEIADTLYRQKIYEDTKQIRNRLIGS